MKTTLTMLIFFTGFSLNTFAQDISHTVFVKHTEDVWGVVFSPDGRFLATGSGDNTIHLLDTNTSEQVYKLEENRQDVRSIAFSPDGKTLAVGSRDNGSYARSGSRVYYSGRIRLLDVTTALEQKTIIVEWCPVRCVAFSPDGRILAIGNDASTFLGGHDLPTVRLLDTTTGNHISRFQYFGTINSIAFSPDGTMLASGGVDDTIRLWDVATGDQLRTFRGHWSDVYSVAFSPDGTTLASGSYDDTIRLWDVATGTHKATLTGHRNTVSSVAFSPDGTTLASGSDDNTIRLWDVATGTHQSTLTEHRGDVNSVAFIPDGLLLASGSDDNTVCFWKLPTKLSITPSEVQSPTIGEQFSINVSIIQGENVGGYQLTLEFDPTALRYVESANGDYLTENSHFVPPVVAEDQVTLGATSFGDVRSGDGILATLTFEVVNIKESNLLLSNVILTDSDGEHLSIDTKDGIIVEPEEIIKPEEIAPVAIPSSAVVSISPSSVISPITGGQFTLTVSITGAQDITNYHLTWEYDHTVLEHVSSSEIYIGADGVGNNSKTLGTRTFKVRSVRPSTVSISGYYIGTDGLQYIPTFENAEVVTAVSTAVVSFTPSSILSPAIGEEFILNVDIIGGQHIAEYYNFRLSQEYDRTALKLIPGGVISTKADGAATLMILKFKVLDVKSSTLSVSGYLIGDDGIAYIPTFESAEVIEPLIGDVNRDGVVNISDLVMVGASFGQTVTSGGNPADVNEDGTVNIVDLIMVAGVIGSGSAAPTALQRNLVSIPTRENVQEWIKQAQHLDLIDANSQQGIHFLEQLLKALTPKKTALLANYPNPFNPETWIPYQLAKPTDVTVYIYAVNGKLVRRLDLGHQPIGIYQHKSRAAYWDGKNAMGESVASGVYFYTLTAGEFTATRKMLIRK